MASDLDQEDHSVPTVGDSVEALVNSAVVQTLVALVHLVAKRAAAKND